jgi:hypothetical protein
MEITSKKVLLGVVESIATATMLGTCHHVADLKSIAELLDIETVVI